MMTFIAQRPDRRRSVRANPNERARTLPGDELIAAPLASLTHAITIRASRRDVWPWLIQMGAGTRGGWYSYDLIDNGRQPSAVRIVPRLQHIAVGTVFPALPGVADAFVVVGYEPDRSLVLAVMPFPPPYLREVCRSLLAPATHSIVGS
jgi:hypothetical protein